MNHHEVMASLSFQLNKLTDSIKHKNIIYIDYPIHHNIGDLLIYLGALKLLDSQGFEIVSRMSVFDFSPGKVKRIIKKYGDVSIVLHGGGNLGDLYALHQNCRLKVLSEISDVNTVIFPQTIHYKDETNLKNDAKVFNNHSDLTLFVRDKISLNFAELLCQNSHLAPDTAHRLWEEESFLNVSKAQGSGDLIFRRRDIESSNPYVNYFDWQDLITIRDEKYKKRIRKILEIDRLGLSRDFLSQGWEDHAVNLCQRAAIKLNQYDFVETDRLHGHILSCLLDRKNLVLDNSYGKNLSYIKAWTALSPITSFE